MCPRRSIYFSEDLNQFATSANSKVLHIHSSPISEDKRHSAGLALGWVTALEHRKPISPIFTSSFFTFLVKICLSILMYLLF